MSLLLKEPQVQYITNQGKTSGVIVALKDYKRLIQAMEDLRDIRSAERRRDEASIEYATYRKKRLARMKSAR